MAVSQHRFVTDDVDYSYFDDLLHLNIRSGHEEDVASWQLFEGTGYFSTKCSIFMCKFPLAPTRRNAFVHRVVPNPDGQCHERVSRHVPLSCSKIEQRRHESDGHIHSQKLRQQ
mgnify:CR=1 FL=1